MRNWLKSGPNSLIFQSEYCIIRTKGFGHFLVGICQGKVCNIPIPLSMEWLDIKKKMTATWKTFYLFFFLNRERWRWWRRRKGRWLFFFIFIWEDGFISRTLIQILNSCFWYGSVADDQVKRVVSRGRWRGWISMLVADQILTRCTC